MSKIVAWLMAYGGTMAVNILVAIGFTAVSYAGVAEVCETLVEYAQSTWGGIPVDVLRLASLAGIPECLGMMFGAAVSIMAIKLSISGTQMVLKRKL